MPDAYQWEVWQAVWEHEDGTRKERPVLILTSTTYNFANAKIWVAKFTKTKRDSPYRFEFATSDPSFQTTGLTATCYLYVNEAREIDKALLLRKRGHLGTLAPWGL